MELSNPDVMLQALDAERQLAQARADLINLRNTLKTQELAQQSTIATLHTDEADARRKAAALGNLKGIVSDVELQQQLEDRKSTRLNSSHLVISYAVFCLKKK